MGKATLESIGRDLRPWEDESWVIQKTEKAVPLTAAPSPPTTRYFHPLRGQGQVTAGGLASALAPSFFPFAFWEVLKPGGQENPLPLTAPPRYPCSSSLTT